VPPSEPKLPVTRTLPPIDVVFEDEREEVGQKSSRLDVDEKTVSTAVRVSPADLAVLRRIALRAGEGAESEPPRSSIRVAAKGTLSLGRYTALFVGALGLVTEVVRIWHPEHASVIGAIARGLAQLAGVPVQ
jgi:hypothetical protein